MAVKPRAIELHIDELVLRGFSQADRLAVGDAVERELSRLIAERGIAGIERHAPELDRIDAGRFQAEPGARVPGIGAQVAGALHRGLTSTGKTRSRRGL
jgi:hypothetical protein